MPFEVAQPKYAKLVRAVQERIENGTYPVGSTLPTEAQFAQEFGISRPTVVRALEILGRDGWVESQQGRGRFVLARVADDEHARHGAVVVSLDESAGGRLLHVGHIVAPPRVREMLGLPDGTAVLVRRVLVSDVDGPVELVTTYVPLSVAEGTDLGADRLLAGGLRAHLEQRKRIRLAHATEAVTARAAGEADAKALAMLPGAPLLVVWVVVSDSTGNPAFVTEDALPADRHELEGRYALD